MADPVHLGLLGQGLEAWEQYRVENPATRLDLTDADLSKYQLAGSHLIGANLNNAILTGVNLSRARLDFTNLSGASLKGADLRGACLTHSNLINTDLESSDLSRSVLSSANFYEAILHKANFTGAFFENTDLSGAYLAETILVDTSLRNVNGLESCMHHGPSLIDFKTLERSGNLPINFLRGCGLPDLMIEYLPSIINQPIQYHSSFISYSSKDDKLAKRLYADLQDSGVRCWFAPEDMKIGDKFRSRIDEVIHVHEKLLLVLSEESIKSGWVEKEVETAFEKERLTGRTVLFPIRLDDTVLKMTKGWAADVKRTRHIGDFTGWKDHDKYQASFQRLLRDLKVESS